MNIMKIKYFAIFLLISTSYAYTGQQTSDLDQFPDLIAEDFEELEINANASDEEDDLVLEDGPVVRQIAGTYSIDPLEDNEENQALLLELATSQNDSELQED